MSGSGFVVYPMGWDAWVTCRNMRFKLVLIPRSQPEPTSNFTRRSKHSALVTTGIAKSILPTRLLSLDSVDLRELYRRAAYLAEVPVFGVRSVLSGKRRQSTVRVNVVGIRSSDNETMDVQNHRLCRSSEDLDLDWPTGTLVMQKEWIGKSFGAEVDFEIQGHDEALTVFTTRPDTLYGATYMVIAPEKEIVQRITTAEHQTQVLDYIERSIRKSERDRVADTKEKTGVFTGAYAINPVTKTPIPIWISDYVLASYGTGAIMRPRT